MYLNRSWLHDFNFGNDTTTIQTAFTQCLFENVISHQTNQLDVDKSYHRIIFYDNQIFLTPTETFPVGNNLSVHLGQLLHVIQKMRDFVMNDTCILYKRWILDFLGKRKCKIILL